MAGLDFSVEPKGLAEARGRLMALGGFATAELMADISAVLESSTRARFDTRTAPDGAPWPEWSDAYAATREAQHSLLVNEGELRDSIAGSSDRDEARVGSPLIYAAIHQFGGEEVGKAIPPRPFLGLSDEDEADIMDLVQGRLMEAGR